MDNLIETTATSNPKIVTESRDGVSLGRLILPTKEITKWEPSPTFLHYLNILNGPDQKKAETARKSLTFYLNNNTANNEGDLTHERPVSAYFTDNPQNQELIIEWGVIDPKKGVAKLHTYLNEVVDYQTRAKQGMKLTSGHIAKISNSEEEIYLALLDGLLTSNPSLTKHDHLGKLVNTLHAYNFIPVAADGTIQLPAFVD